ncbi:uracil phosphoribosyltransferase [Luteolibacter pohnpeiensis]|uniref:Uracil phosphoribosyltransferase n=1 Tax=Luteolibacter pohnpeiensis TaxID=454153 RepID=A0A934S7H6_9BACT|nr:uracil phosphoribosyltransferase [Luteolibacter pohnpeiensis]MBK1880779.1 uracil phosphoribosyltransferase [Luteolibacter pohnpeiensis]
MIHVLDHPLITDELTRLRDPICPTPEFRQRVRRIASLMVPAVTANLQSTVVPCTTPLEITSGKTLTHSVVLVPILRAGLGFLDGFLDLIPNAAVAHIGLARNEETLKPEPYYIKHPPSLADSEIIVLDPMLATGGSAVEGVRRLQAAGATRIRFACLVAAPEGVATFESECPDVPIFAASLDRCLDSRGYILPGLGDAGDRLFGTAGTC